MKRRNLVLIALLSGSVMCAQAQKYTKGTSVVSAGIGLGSSLNGGVSTTQSPAISIQFEHGIHEAGPGIVSLGGYLGFKSYKYSNKNGYTAKWNYTIIGIRSAYHYTGFDVENLDVYGGLMVSYNNLHYSDNYTNGNYNYGSNIGFTAFAGGRYFFSKNLGAFAELGYGVAYLNGGLALKL